MIAALLLAGAAFAAPAGTASSRDVYANSVVGLLVTYQDWDDRRPWAKQNPGVRRASGVVVEGPAILTSAEMVQASANIQVEKFGRSTRLAPKVLYVDKEANLALLGVDEPSFWADLVPVRLASGTPVEGTLRTVRWRSQQLEVAASRVKRFEVEEAWYGRLGHVFLQVQTDLQGGGWADPVFDDGRLVGITVSQQSDQRARVIPVEILAPFLERARDPARYRPFPVFGAKWQVNSDPALAAWLGQKGEPEGVVIRQVPWGSSGCGVLKPLDILLSIDGVALDAEGTYAHPRFGRLEFPQRLVERHVAGDAVPVRVLRQGKVLDLTMTLRAYPVEQALIPARRGGAPPPYLIAGGLVFRELDVDYLRSWGSDWSDDAPLPLVTRTFLDQEAQTPERRRLVILEGVVPTEYTVGYESLSDLVVAAVNGRKVESIAEVADALSRPEGGFDTIELEPNPDRREIVLDAEGLAAATARVLEEYGIPAAQRLDRAPLPDGGPACPGDF